MAGAWAGLSPQMNKHLASQDLATCQLFNLPLLVCCALARSINHLTVAVRFDSLLMLNDALSTPLPPAAKPVSRIDCRNLPVAQPPSWRDKYIRASSSGGERSLSS